MKKRPLIKSFIHKRSLFSNSRIGNTKIGMFIASIITSFLLVLCSTSSWAQISDTLPPTCSSALNFNGTSNYLELEFDLIPAEDVSFAGWVKPSSVSNETILKWGDLLTPFSSCSATNSVIQTFMISNGKLTFTTSCSGTTVSSSQTLEVDKWYHVAFTIDNTGLITLYINGLADGSGNGRATSTSNVATGFNYIGANYNWTTDNYFHGTMTELSVWGKVLTSTEIINLSSRSGLESEQDLIAYYPMNEGVGNYTVKDQASVDGLASRIQGIGNFNGFDTHVEPNVPIYSDAAFSILFKINPIDISNGTLFSHGPKGGCGSASSESLMFKDGKLRFVINCDTNSFIETTTTLNSGTTYEIALTVNDTGTVSIYLDGNLEATGEPRRGNVVGSGFEALGFRYSSNNIVDVFSGFMEEVSFWSVALPASEISSTISNSSNNLRARYFFRDYDGGFNVNDVVLREIAANGRAFNLSVYNDDIWTVANNKNLNTGISLVNDVLIADNDSADGYQWLEYIGGDGELSEIFEPIPGEVNETLDIAESGIYILEITQGFCTDSSDFIEVTPTAIFEKVDKKNTLEIHPNPATSILFLRAGFVQVFDQLGHLVMEVESIGQIDVSGLGNGVYIITMDGKRTKLIIE